MFIKKNKEYFNLIINTFMLLTISSITFLMPIFILESKSFTEIICDMQTMIIFITLLINETIFILQSEIVKYCLGTEKCKKLLNTKYSAPKLSIIQICLTTVTMLVHWNIYKNIIALVCIIPFFVVNNISVLCFDLIGKSQNLYRKRDFLFFRPFPIISTPLCTSFFWVYGQEGNIEHIFLIIVNILVVLLYYIMLKRKKVLEKTHFVSILIFVFLSYILAYVFLSTETKNFIFSNMDIFLFSCCYSLYLCLLYSLMYSRLYPIRTEKFNKSIEKFQTYMFAFFPLIAFPLFVFLSDATVHLYLFAIINICAFFLIGKKLDKREIVNTIFTLILIIVFFVVAFSTLRIRNHSIYNVNIKFNGEIIASIIIGILGLVATFWAEKSKPQNKFIKILKMPKYTASTVCIILLFILTVIFQDTMPNETKAYYPMYFYCLFNLLCTGISFYFEYDKTYNKD